MCLRRFVQSLSFIRHGLHRFERLFFVPYFQATTSVPYTHWLRLSLSFVTLPSFFGCYFYAFLVAYPLHICAGHRTSLLKKAVGVKKCLCLPSPFSWCWHCAIVQHIRSPTWRGSPFYCSFILVWDSLARDNSSKHASSTWWSPMSLRNVANKLCRHLLYYFVSPLNCPITPNSLSTSWHESFGPWKTPPGSSFSF